MRTILLALLFAPSLALAGGHDAEIANMTNHCRCVMEGGVCQVTKAKPARGTVYTTAGAIPAEVYERFRKNPLMCQDGRQACTEDWDGQACRQGFRLMFRQQPVVCRP